MIPRPYKEAFKNTTESELQSNVQTGTRHLNKHNAGYTILSLLSFPPIEYRNFSTRNRRGGRHVE